MPDIINIVPYIIKYIITAPVSGSKKVSIDGIKIIINVLSKNINSSFIVGLGLSL